MKHTRRLLGFLVCLALLGPTAVQIAGAQDDEATEIARERFKEGVRYFDDNEFGKARVAFAQAYALKQHPDVLLNLGLSEARSPGHEAAAAAHLTEYLRQASDSEKRDQAESALEDVRGKILTVNVEVDVPVTAVLVNDEAYTAGPVPGPLFLESGSHTIEIQARDDTKSQDVSGDPGDEETLEFVFASPPKPAAPAAVAAAPPPEKKGRRDKSSSRERSADDTRLPFFKWMVKRPLALVLGGVGLAGAGTGVGFYFAAKNEYDNADVLEAGILARSELDAAMASSYPTNPDLQAFAAALGTQGPCGGGGRGPVALTPDDTRYQEWCAEYYDTKARGDDYQAISIVSFGIGGAALLALPIYYVVDRGSKRSRSAGTESGTIRMSATPIRVTPAVGGGFTGLAVSGQF